MVNFNNMIKETEVERVVREYKEGMKDTGNIFLYATIIPVTIVFTAIIMALVL